VQGRARDTHPDPFSDLHLHGPACYRYQYCHRPAGCDSAAAYPGSTGKSSTPCAARPNQHPAPRAYRHALASSHALLSHAASSHSTGKYRRANTTSADPHTVPIYAPRPNAHSNPGCSLLANTRAARHPNSRASIPAAFYIHAGSPNSAACNLYAGSSNSAAYPDKNPEHASRADPATTN
jgi:hypothetical protein